MTEQSLSPGIRYLLEAGRLVDRLLADEWPSIRAGAELVADALGTGGVVHAFGTGHSHMLAEELFYRAGGLVRVEPILFEGLMLHAGARLSTSLERLPGLADALLADHPMAAGDVLVVASNSGGNAVGSALAARARELGVRVVAIESVAHATSAGRRHNLGHKPRKTKRQLRSGGSSLVHESDVGRFNRCITACRAHCDAERGAAQRRCVVHSIANHRNPTVFGDERLHRRHFVRR